jgi:hypothetical protein
MDAYYLWDPDRSIDIGHAISRGSESRFLVTVKRPDGLQSALIDLGVMAMAHGKKRRLEVHCHGNAGSISLGGNAAVSNHNVRAFGSALRQALLPGGLIELLACLVASQEGNGSMLAAPKQRISGYRDDYHGAIRLVRTRDYDRSPAMMRSGTVGPDGVTTLGPAKLTMKRNEFPHYGGRFTQKESPIQDDPSAFFTPAFETDGLRFCLELANSSGCTVRAACRIQTEEGGRTGFERLARTPIGNWEYEVFDFHPDGHIQFLGSSPYRGPINSFDQINKFPTA